MRLSEAEQSGQRPATYPRTRITLTTGPIMEVAPGKFVKSPRSPDAIRRKKRYGVAEWLIALMSVLFALWAIWECFK